MSDGLFDVRVKRISYEADGINSYELISPTGHDLDPFTAGGHIDVHLPNGMVRSYSLVNDQRERHRYVIAINKDTAGRGGSRLLHDNLKAGDVLRVSRPRNNFALCEQAEHSVLIAGGIGITPLLSMARRLDALGRPCELFYAARAPRAAAFLDEIAVLAANGRLKVRLDFDDQRSGRLFDLAAVIDRAPAQAHLYCCGPQPMLEAFEAAAAGRPADHRHVEYFQASEAPATAGGFELKLARSNRTIPVEAGKTILEALLEAGIAANHACSEGVCGTCETRVLEGIPDHRDQFLSKDEQASNKTMMICCSGARSGRLVLDL
ncbi:PDR/VanB family oxidoreductase [Bradyrhizobium vignae]|uniref:PDR/VanB family oxidoreductase n=1 Tax=Bradyrhizobium vignae TaxID=1549949 RepID=UPI00100A31AB|nr:PDR/VanB family oxidoreductase [Bradyrhizobium vignae]RXH04296.1 oxidoreductase [Bradyrhizobium vignae]